MGLNKLEMELKRDLQGVASDLKWSCVELMQISQRLGRAGNDADAQALERLIHSFHAAEHRLGRYAEEVQAGGIARSSVCTEPLGVVVEG